MTNTEGRINYTKRTARPVEAPRSAHVLQTGETIVLSGPRAGQVIRPEPVRVPTISYRKG